MTSGGWHTQEHRHGRHHRDTTGEAWTPAERPTDAAPDHAWRDGPPAFRLTGMAPPPVWPVSEEVTDQPVWPVDPPQEPETTDAPAWPPSREPAYAMAAAERNATPPDMLADTVPMAWYDEPEAGSPSGAMTYPLTESPLTGLGTFDLGTVPASVTPPRSWRKAAWFAVGTSAAVALGLTVATSELMGRPVDDGRLIDALPGYPSGPLTLSQLPHDAGTPSSGRPDDGGAPTSHRGPSTTVATPPSSQDDPPRDTVTGRTSDEESVVPTEPPSKDTTAAPPTTSAAATTAPTRTTVGPPPVLLADPQQMGDATEEYFELVTIDPAAALAMATGGLAREGEEGIEARYGRVERVEVQDITIDRDQAFTTSRVEVVHENGARTVEQRRLKFTWGDDPKITEDTITG
ncbi:MAG: hypothetical protein WBA97_16150 [Actinophytocola sp.]|uniref:hypothetical protein n=1 Tax=Actinophytocola sp. TaxID=1872138 RepID=UPI003C73C932